MTRAEVMAKFQEGFEDWKRFCRLMEKYPKDSYAKLQLRMLLTESYRSGN